MVVFFYSSSPRGEKNFRRTVGWLIIIQETRNRVKAEKLNIFLNYPNPEWAVSYIKEK